MTYLSFSTFPSVQEPSSPYSPFPRKKIVYEISLRAVSSRLQNLSDAHRVVQALLQGELLGGYDLLDFVVWPGGILTRISLKKAPSLAEFLRFLKGKSTPPEKDYQNFWEDEPQWIRLVPPEKLSESTRSFMERAELLRQDVRDAGGFLPKIFFFYRNSRYNP